MKSLQEITLTKIAYYLWNISPIPDIVWEGQESHWSQTEINIKEKVVHLASERELLADLVPEVKKYVRIIGKEIFKFLFYLHDSIRIDNTTLKLIVSQSCWMKGAILDSTKTIYKAIQNEDLDAGEKFALASYFCIESCIKELWDNLSDGLKATYLNPELYIISVKNLWAFKLANKRDRLEDILDFYDIDSLSEFIIYVLVRSFSIDAIKFYFEKLSDERKHSVPLIVLQRLHEWFPNDEQRNDFDTLYSGFQENFNSLLVYFFSLINAESFEEVLNRPVRTYRILGCYLDWPYQEKFLETANILKNHMVDEDFQRLTQYINSKIALEYNDFDYESLLDQNKAFSRSILTSD